jgi:hypothetical protein
MIPWRGLLSTSSRPCQVRSCLRMPTYTDSPWLQAWGTPACDRCCHQQGPPPSASEGRAPLREFTQHQNMAISGCSHATTQQGDRQGTVSAAASSLGPAKAAGLLPVVLRARRHSSEQQQWLNTCYAWY